VPSYLIDSGAELDPAWVHDARVVGITAGASAPEELVDDVVAALRRVGPVELEVLPGNRRRYKISSTERTCRRVGPLLLLSTTILA